MELKVVYQVDGGLGGAEVVVVPFLLHSAAGGAGVSLVVQVDIAQAEGEFHAPAASQQEVVAVGEAAAYAPALVAAVLQRREEAEGQFDARGVELPAQQVAADEVSVERLAEPITVFGLHNPMLQLLGVRIFPRLEAGHEAQGGFGVESNIHTHVGSAGAPIEQIGLQHGFLGQGREGGSQQAEDKDEYGAQNEA